MSVEKNRGHITRGMELGKWIEAMVVLTVAMVMVLITLSFKQRKETFAQPRKNLGETGVDYEVYFSVVNSYKGVLDRPPSEAEIQMQKARLTNDKEYDIRKLEATLRQSAEYKRLVALQKNTVFAELEGNITERQVTEKVKARYMAVAGQEPDTATLKFLMERYTKSNLDDVYLQALIENITMTPMASSTYVGPDGPGGGKMAPVITKGVLASDVAAAKRLYEQLGIDGAMLDDILRGQDPTAMKGLTKITNASGDTGKATGTKNGAEKCAANAEVLGMSPDEVRAYVIDGERRRMRTQACNYAKVKRAQDLSDVGMAPGQDVGSWTMPGPTRPPVCTGGRGDLFEPAVEQSSLIGTLLTEETIQHPDMTLFG